MIEANGPLYVGEIASQLGEHPITVEREVKQLHNDGYLSRIGRNYYEMADDGQRILDV